jgi:hypothetical protein
VQSASRNVGADLLALTIVAEHFLQVRIAKIQSRATYMSAFVGFVGGLAGAALLILFQSNT